MKRFIKNVGIIILVVLVIMCVSRCRSSKSSASRQPAKTDVAVSSASSSTVVTSASEAPESVAESIASSVAESIAPSSEAETVASESESQSESTSTSSELDPDGMRPEFKAAMDSYEEYFNKYCEFMKNFDSTTATPMMLIDYGKFMAQYADTMAKMDKIGEEELNDAELKYYIAVTSRIQQKLVDVAI